MSLVPVSASNPFVPKINKLLESAITKLNTSAPPPASASAPRPRQIASAFKDASTAISLLEQAAQAKMPIRNITLALKSVREGAAMLSRLVQFDIRAGKDPVITVPQFREQSASNALKLLQTAHVQLNRHHF